MGLFEIALWIVCIFLLVKTLKSKDEYAYQVSYPAADKNVPEGFKLELLNGLYYVWTVENNKFVTQGSSIGEIKQNMAKIYNLKPENFKFDITEVEMES